MSVLSRSVTTAHSGRSFAGAPVLGDEEGPVPAAGGRCACGAAGKPGTVTVLYPAHPSAAPFRPAPGGRRGKERLRNNFSVRSLADREAGMATAEYAIATLAAVAFAALLVAVLGSGEVRSLLMGLIRSALTLG